MPNGAGYVHARLTNADEDNFVKVDGHGALVGIDFMHHEIHEGEVFSAFTLFAGVADAGTRGILVRVPALTIPRRTRFSTLRLRATRTPTCTRM